MNLSSFVKNIEKMKSLINIIINIPLYKIYRTLTTSSLTTATLYTHLVNHYKNTDLDIRVIHHNQFLEAKDKFPEFDINEFAFNPYYHLPHILKTGEVVLWSHLYVHVLVFSGLSDRNRECTIQTEYGGLGGVNPDSLLWIE